MSKLSISFKGISNHTFNTIKKKVMYNKKSDRFSPFVENALRKAGWFPNRNKNEFVSQWKLELEKSDGWEIFPAAEKVLLEFGGLKIDQNGAGQTCAREPFEINPTLAIYESDRFGDCEVELKTKLYPLGEAANRYYFLVIGEDGRVFLIMTDIHLIGETFDEALENLIIGVQSKPL